jgi:glycosyltransferase involved in cell wall biosynthesis
MKLASLCHDRLPVHFTNTAQLVCTMAELARIGHHVEILCRKSGAGNSTTRESIAAYYGLGAIPDPLTVVPVAPAGVDGSLFEGIADVLNVLHARRNKRDIIHTRDLLALSLALAAGLPCVLETYRVDINQDWRLARWRAFSYRHKNLLGVVTHSELCRRSFVEAGVPESRVATIYNGYTPAHFNPLLTREAARARLNLPLQSQIATYTGHVDANKGVDILVRIALKLPNVTFLLVGAVPGSEGERRVVELARELGAGNVRVLPRVPHAEVPLYLFASDCLIIPPTAAPLRKHGRTVLPMKTFSYLAAGRPIVAPDLPDLREVLRADDNALLVPPDDTDTAAESIQLAISNRAVSDRLASAAQRDAAGYTWHARAERLSAFLQKVCAAAGLHAEFAPHEFAGLIG